MKHRKLFRRVFALVLSLATVFMFSPFAVAASTEAAQQAAFDALPDNAIVCYMYGQPVYKYEVDENHIIHKDFYSSSVSTYASGPTSTIPTAHRGSAIYAGCTLVTSGYSQAENIMYLPVDKAVKVANKFAVGAATASALQSIFDRTTTAGFMANMFLDFTKVSLQGIADDMNALLNSGNRVELCVTSSSYGQFCNVQSWNGTSCVRYGFSQNGTTYTVNSVICDGCGSSVWG